MKLGQLVHTRESRDDVSDSEVVSDTAYGDKKNISIFPDISIPDELSFSVLKKTNETLESNSELASDSKRLLLANLESLQVQKVLTPLGAAAIGAQVRNIYSVFPETQEQDIEYLDKIIPSDTPTVVQVTTEALQATADNLNPAIVNSLAAAGNINAFLTQNVNIPKIRKDLQDSKTLIEHTEKLKVEGKDEYSLVDHNQLFPKILRAVQAGYDPDEITETFERELSEGDSIPDTAIIAIQRGIKKLPLERTREVNGIDIGHLSTFVQSTTSIQELTSKLLQSSSQAMVDNRPGSGSLMQVTETIKGLIAQFTQEVATLAESSANKESLPKGDGDDVLAEFCTMPNGRKVVMYKNGDIQFPQVVADRTFGFIIPSQIADSATACLESLVPALINLKKRVEEVSLSSKRAAELISTNLKDNGESPASQAFHDTVKRLLTVVKFSNTMATLAAEASVQTCQAVLDISRGVGILMET